MSQVERMFTELLEKEGSNLAWVLRLSLHGLRAQLKEALKGSSGDSGQDTCEELVAQLDTLLNPPSSSEPTRPEDFLEPVEPVQKESSLKLELEPVKNELLAAKELQNYLGSKYQFQSNDDGHLWQEIQLLLLRIPEQEAATWKEKLREQVKRIGAKEDKQSLGQIYFPRSEIIYEGLKKETIKSQGLRFISSAKPDPRLEYEPAAAEELNVLAGVVSAYLKFIEELDPSNLHHALKSLELFKIQPLTSKIDRDKYINALLERFRRVRATINDEPAIALKARLDLDEAIHSLVYLPPANRYSWWGKLQQEARRTLEPAIDRARQGGHQIYHRYLWGTYADIYKLSKDDISISEGGMGGEVAASLRVYAVIDGDILPGRVIYCTS